MPLTLEQAAERLGVSAETMRRWARQGLLGARLPGGEVRFEEAELRRWARRHGLRFQAAPAAGPSTPAAAAAASGPLEAALRRGRVLGEIPGGGRDEVLAHVVKAAPLPAGADRDRLREELRAREELSSTALGGGVAIPHPRHPSPAFAPEAMVVAGWPRPEVDWRALDGRPVHSVFVLLSPGPREHLQVLSHLAFLVRDAAFCAFLAAGPDVLRLLEEIGRREPGSGS